MLHVCFYGYTERLLCALHEVASASSMHVQLYSAWYYIAAFGVDNLSVNDVQITVRYG